MGLLHSHNAPAVKLSNHSDIVPITRLEFSVVSSKLFVGTLQRSEGTPDTGNFFLQFNIPTAVSIGNTNSPRFARFGQPICHPNLKDWGEPCYYKKKVPG